MSRRAGYRRMALAVLLSVLALISVLVLVRLDEETAPVGPRAPEQPEARAPVAPPAPPEPEAEAPAAEVPAAALPAASEPAPVVERPAPAAVPKPEPSEPAEAAPAVSPPQAEPTEEPIAWRRPRFDERKEERRRMVRDQIARRGVREGRVLEALRNVPRHRFVPAGRLREAYADRPLGIGHGQTISQPYIVGLMTEMLRIEPGDRVLEIGTGSGYQAAVLSELTPHVFTIEIIEALHKSSAQRLKDLGYETVRTRRADGYHGWPEQGPFDAIIVTAAAGHVPPPLLKQLKPGGRMAIPIGSPYSTQRLLLVEKDEHGNPSTRDVLPVRFVPMTGRAQR